MIAKTFPEKNIVFGLNQQEFTPLPAHVTQWGDATFCFELNEHEVKEILKEKMLYITRLTFGHRMQPIVKNVIKPRFSQSGHHDYHTSEVLTTLAPRMATDREKKVKVVLKLDEKELKQIEQTKCVWITTFMFGQPFQPVVLSTKNPYK
ncbi:MAG: hypothetical protein HQ522_16310 [Bacteroidetes bacterium]|nr:hypothetical protein [Bacteroidota bacterium]